MLDFILDLQIFGEGGAAGGTGAAGGEAGPSAEGDAPITEGTLPDGTRVDKRLAERMEKQRKRNPDLYRQAQPAEAQGEQKQQEQANPDDDWNEVKKRYADQYGKDVQAAIQDRFKNQADLKGQLDGLKPMLDALAKQRGIQAGDYQALSQAILDDDSLYEDDAEAAGMTVDAYKQFKALEAEAQAARQQREQNQQEASFRQHLSKLISQGEALKQTFPDFDLQKELENPNFKRMTAPDVGLSVEDAYYAVHHAELAPKAVMAGMQHAQRQIAQSLQANASRPVEGAMTGNQQAAHIAIDPKSMTREQRQRMREDFARRTARGEKVILD